MSSPTTLSIVDSRFLFSTIYSLMLASLRLGVGVGAVSLGKCVHSMACKSMLFPELSLTGSGEAKY